MFLQLNHQKLEVYQVLRRFILECYNLTNNFPTDEHYNLTSKIRRAALSMHLNIAEAVSRRSPWERKMYFEISRDSVIEIDAASVVAFDLGDFNIEKCVALPEITSGCFQFLSKLISSTV